MDENKKISWTDLFVKIILVIIFTLFAVWLLSLSNKEMSKSVSVLTDEVFADNIERMKEVGKEYFTTERLPEEVGDIEIITLQKMYDKHLLLELQDKYGNTCSAENSYVSIEKYDTEYQMKVYLDCGGERDYVISIMGCYDYCDTDICEKKEEDDDDNNTTTELEYEYKKTTGGSWSSYGSWSEWSTTAVTETTSRQVETKTETETYTYDKTSSNTIYASYTTTCPSGYTKSSDGTTCYSTSSSSDTKDPVCASRTSEGLTFIGRSDFTCYYSKSTTDTVDATCPAKSGYTVTRSGNTCTYTKTTTDTQNATCATLTGWNYIGRTGNTCSYSKTVQVAYTDTEKVAKTCTGTNSKTCTGTTPKTCTGTTSKTCYKNETTSTVSCNKGKCSRQYTNVYVPYDCSETYTYDCSEPYTYDCSETYTYDCSYTQNVTKYKNETQTNTQNATCASGYTLNNGKCTKTTTDKTTASATCASGYTLNNGKCTKTSSATTTSTATCSTGYTKSGSSCVKTESKINYTNLEKTCPSGYSLTSDSKQCYKIVSTSEKAEGTHEVTYYRYRTRTYTGGAVVYKWSSSNEDKDLINAGYTLTGNTRNKTSK